MEKYASVAAPHTESAVWKGRRHGPRGRRVGAASPEPSCCGASGGSSVCDAPDGSTLSASGLASVRSLGTRAPYLGCATCGPTNVSRLVVGGFPAGVASPPAWLPRRRGLTSGGPICGVRPVSRTSAAKFHPKTAGYCAHNRPVEGSAPAGGPRRMDGRDIRRRLMPSARRPVRLRRGVSRCRPVTSTRLGGAEPSPPPREGGHGGEGG